jgi:hypothetical protein
LRTRVLTIAMVILLFLTLQVASMADYRQVGGYVYSHGEERFIDNVWGFVKHFDDGVNTWEALWGRNWSRGQYYWAEMRMFNTEHQYFVDSMDLAFYSGHGNHYWIKMNPWDGVDLTDAPGYGDLPNNGDLEFIIFESCDVIPGPGDLPAGSNWWDAWVPTGGKHIFQGLHQALGYRTLSWSGNGISSNFANRIKVGQPVWQSWFNAVNDERNWWDSLWIASYYPGYASAVMHADHQNDTIYNYGGDPSMTSWNLTMWYQH